MKGKNLIGKDTAAHDRPPTPEYTTRLLDVIINILPTDKYYASPELAADQRNKTRCKWRLLELWSKQNYLCNETPERNVWKKKNQGIVSVEISSCRLRDVECMGIKDGRVMTKLYKIPRGLPSTATRPATNILHFITKPPIMQHEDGPFWRDKGYISLKERSRGGNIKATDKKTNVKEEITYIFSPNLSLLGSPPTTTNTHRGART